MTYMLENLIINLSDDLDIANDLEAVVRSAAKEFTAIFPGRPPAGERPIVVFYRREGPITNSTADLNVYRIGLTVRDHCYDQLVFQFGHELCDVFTDPRRSNWFVECCCEMASLMLLRRMSEVWAYAPPFPHWVSYAPRFEDYAKERVRDATVAWFGSDSLPDQAQLCK